MKLLAKYLLWPLVIIGALNWGLIGLCRFNLVTWILGTGVWARLVYVVVGLAAVALIIACIVEKLSYETEE